MNNIFFFRRSVKRLLVLMMITVGMNAAYSQTNLATECVNINQAYLSTPYLSFNIKYKYSLESAPTVIEDSSLAEYKINGDKYWGTIDNIEFMQNESFLVTLFKDEKIMSLALPSQKFSQSLPMGQWDSLFFENDRYTFSASVDGAYKKITVDYNADLPYKKFEMWYDSITYRVQRIKYVISEFASDENFYALSDPGDYGIVDILFSNYQTGVFNDDVFYSSLYIQPHENSYVAAETYSDYQFYISSPGLLK